MTPVVYDWANAVETHHELIPGENHYDYSTRTELLSMTPATIDQYLKAERDRLRLKGISTTKPGALLPNSITVPKAGDEIEEEPGFFEADTVAHCGPP